MFGYATDETPELMPLPIMLAHRITAPAGGRAQAGPLRYLRPDGKAQVTVRYRSSGGRLVPVAVERLLVSTQHDPDVPTTQIKADVIEHVLLPGDPGGAVPARAAVQNRTSCWSTRPGGSSPAARWATPA